MRDGADEGEGGRWAGLRADRLPDETLARLRATVDLATLVLGASTAVLDIDAGADRRHRVTVSGHGRLDQSADALCTEVADGPGTVIVDDTTLDPRLRHHPCVTGEQGTVRFLAVVPLVTSDGTTVGRMCVLDDRPRPTSTHHVRALTALAERSVDVLELGLRTAQLERTVAELTAARTELRRSNEELSLFAGHVSHDLRNPLTAVLANTEVVASLASHDETLVEFAQAARDAGRRMDLLMRGYLAYAQVGGELDVTDVPLVTVAHAVLEDVRSVTTQTGATVRVGDLPVVRADAGKLYAVLLNLVTNALKFGGADQPPQIEIDAERAGDRWRVTVADRGPGVPEEDRDRIFGLFERGHDPQAAPGRGIGLSVVRRVVSDHGGRIGVDDRPGDGSVFWFELPD